ncbi:hypothetical protein AKO1_011060 [Acrasis kona]|uniref:RWP-RK domain-containing protein n=1 Tax=Acrasis kona TaxID=1008807 RepID=A0AAW2YTY3_9EUKA
MSAQKKLIFVNMDFTTKQQRMKSRKLQVSTKQLAECMHLPQTVACKELNISLSTLKRRFYELGIGKWNANNKCTKQKKTLQSKADISYILNKKDGVDSTCVNCGVDWLDKALKHETKCISKN